MSTAHDLCFDPAWYLSAYKDVAASKIDPLTHYLKSGRFEGRKPCAADAHDAMILWTTARRAAAKGDWAGAKVTFGSTDLPTLAETLRHPDAILLILEILTIAGDLPAAKAILNAALADMGPRPALSLAQANLIRAETGLTPDWLGAANLAFPKHTVLQLRDGPTPAFERLRVTPRRASPGIGSKPKVSVIVPVLNAKDTLATALSSLLHQTWANLEILVVDNGSTDGSAQIAEQFSAQDPRVTLIDGSDDPGAYPARNLGFAAATGAFITVQDADDWAHPDKIALQVKALQKAKSAQACLSDWARATPALHFTNTRDDVHLIHANMSSLMIRSDLRETLGFWDRVQADADTEYHQRILHQFGPKSVVRVRPGQLLSIGRHREASLTQNPETALSEATNAPRALYQSNARDWHAAMKTPYMAQYPTERPFPAPDALTKGIRSR